MHRRVAFTLIELLVVIAIISILAAILFPVFASAKASAKQAVCLSNMKQRGLALILYRDDHDDMWAPAASASDAGPGFTPQQMWIGYDNANAPLIGGWYGDVSAPATGMRRPGAIDPYLKSHEVAKCPSQPTQAQLAVAYNWFNPSIGSSYYSTNPAAQGGEFGPGARQNQTHPLGFLESIAANDSEIERPAETLVLWEHSARVPICNFMQVPDWYNSPPNDPGLRDHFNFLHRGGTTTLWADSHAKKLVYGQLRRPMFSCRKDFYPD